MEKTENEHLPCQMTILLMIHIYIYRSIRLFVIVF